MAVKQQTYIIHENTWQLIKAVARLYWKPVFFAIILVLALITSYISVYKLGYLKAEVKAAKTIYIPSHDSSENKSAGVSAVSYLMGKYNIGKIEAVFFNGKVTVRELDQGGYSVRDRELEISDSIFTDIGDVLLTDSLLDQKREGRWRNLNTSKWESRSFQQDEYILAYFEKYVIATK